MNYITKQKDMILDIISKKSKSFLVKDIYEELNHEVGLTTIYRLINKLEKDGLVNKTIGSDNLAYYEYLEKCDHENHFYLKCDKCGILTHIDCDCISELSLHISREHDFKLNKENIIIRGLCSKCK